MVNAGNAVVGILKSRKEASQETKDMEEHPTFVDHDWINSIPMSTGKDPRAVFRPRVRPLGISSGSGRYYHLSQVRD
jgi:hypothetical protein